MNYSNLSIGELLISEDYITIPTPLAIALGLPKSVILKSIYAWCGSNRTQDKKEYFKAGYWWTKGTYEFWQKQMPYIGCVGTVKRLILSLEKDGLIVSDFLHAKRSDREKWYRVDLEALEKFCNAKLVEFAKTMRTKCDDDENTASDSVTKSDDHENKIGRSNGTECDDDLYLNKLSNQPDLKNLVREEEAIAQKALSELEEKSTQDQPIADQSASLSIKQRDSADDGKISGETVFAAAPIFPPQKNNATANYEKRFALPHKYPELKEAGHADIMIGTGYLDFDPIVVEAAVRHLKKHEKPCEVGDAKRFISNRIKQLDWAAIELLKESAATIANDRKKTEDAIAASTNSDEYYDTSRYYVPEPPQIDVEARRKAAESGIAKMKAARAEAKKKRAS